MMNCRLLLFCAVAFFACPFASPFATAQTAPAPKPPLKATPLAPADAPAKKAEPAKTADNPSGYVPPPGSTAPVAPELKKGSPLDHLVNDPKTATPVVGYKEGNTSGPTYFIAHRYIDDGDGLGWGWIKKSGAEWSSAKWIALQESPGLAVAPHRKIAKFGNDVDWEFKFWGWYADYKAYDPRTDEQIPVFVLQGYEVIGPGDPLRMRSGPPDRASGTHGSGASSRSSRPIITNPSVD